MSWTSRNGALNQAEMEGNAREIIRYGRQENWSKTAVAAILGNMQAESTINPGLWEFGQTPYTPTAGYGLVQWTPYTNLADWATLEGLTWEDDGDTQLMRISYEAANGLQWGPNIELGINPPCTFQEFLHDNNRTVDDMSDLWLMFYERPANVMSKVPQRRQNSEDWYTFIGNYGTIPIWLMFKMRQMKGGH